jgi:hypothetical protein
MKQELSNDHSIFLEQFDFGAIRAKNAAIFA